MNKIDTSIKYKTINDDVYEYNDIILDFGKQEVCIKGKKLKIVFSGDTIPQKYRTKEYITKIFLYLSKSYGVPVFKDNTYIYYGNKFDWDKNKVTKQNGDIIQLTSEETKIAKEFLVGGQKDNRKRVAFFRLRKKYNIYI